MAIVRRTSARDAGGRSRLRRLRAPALGIAAGSALLAVGAVALAPSQAPARRAIAAPAAPPPIAQAAKPAADPGIRRFTGRVGADLSQSMTAAGVPERQGREYVALLARAFPLADGLSVDDRFDLIVERHDDGRYGQLVFAGMDRVARADVELLKWTDGKSVIWVNADGVGGEGEQSVHMPVAGHLTSGFGSRFHPILGYARFHKGVDVGAAWGAPITAAADGRVIFAGWKGGYGREVALAHAGGLETHYGHMSRIAVAPGTMVRRGTIIGYVGSSGLSTGPHVHFEVTRDGRAVNPLTAKLRGGPGQLDGAQLVAFHSELRKVLQGSTPGS